MAEKKHLTDIHIHLSTGLGVGESFDYTKWQREHFDALTPEQIHAAVEKHSENHQFQGKKTVIL